MSTARRLLIGRQLSSLRGSRLNSPRSRHTGANSMSHIIGWDTDSVTATGLRKQKGVSLVDSQLQPIWPRTFRTMLTNLALPACIAFGGFSSRGHNDLLRRNVLFVKPSGFISDSSQMYRLTTATEANNTNSRRCWGTSAN